jgi:anti-sigma regulatory factor (Ser/Thr protein kinase)
VATPRFAVTVGGGADELARAQRALERWVEACELAPRPAYRVQLVFEELVTNVLKYAGGSAVEVVVEPAGDELVARFRDRGAPFDPTAAPAPERPDSIEDAKVGGLGLDLVRKAASAVAYRREGDDNVTEVRIPLAGA